MDTCAGLTFERAGILAHVSVFNPVPVGSTIYGIIAERLSARLIEAHDCALCRLSRWIYIRPKKHFLNEQRSRDAAAK